MENRILVTGGSGMVGSALREISPNAIFVSSQDCDLRDCEEVDSLFDRINAFELNPIITLSIKRSINMQQQKTSHSPLLQKVLNHLQDLI